MTDASGAQSIDHAASGVVRHRFVRAFTASWLAAATFSFPLMCLTAGAGEGALSWGVALVFAAAALAAILLGAAVLSAVADLVHRRILALFFLVWPTAGQLGNLLDWAHLYGLIEIEGKARPVLDFQAWETSAAFWITAAQTLIVFELLGWAWWQLTAPREGFFASRAWRPPVWRLVSAFRRRLGLPAFLSHFGRGGLSLGVLYFGVALLNTGLVVVFIAPFALFAMASATSNRNPFAISASDLANPAIIPLLALTALFALHLLGVGNLLARLANRRATRIYQDVREWDERAPVVFLRAFDQDKSRLRVASWDPLAKFPAGVAEARTMDEILLEHGSPYGPVIAVGDPRDPVPPLGAARVFVPGEDASWQHVVTNLVAASKAVVMCPTPSEGVRWELQLIARSGAQAPTIYLASPDLAPEMTAALFAAAAPQGAAPALRAGQIPIAAFHDPVRGWRVLSARRLSVQSVTIALNTALQAMFGTQGEPVVRRSSASAQRPAPVAPAAAPTRAEVLREA